MTPTDFVAGLAEVMDVHQTELATVDRALAKEGLRKIARGRFRPDVTLKEGIQIACAWAGAENLTAAANEVLRLKEFVLVQNDPTEPSTNEFYQLYGQPLNKLRGRNFIDIVVLAAAGVGQRQFDPGRLFLRLEKRGGVEIGYRLNLRDHPLYFQCLGEFDLETSLKSNPRNVSVIVEISGRVLKWIYDVTEGA